MTMEGADLNSYLVRELRAMIILAESLGYSQDCETFREHAGRLGRLVNDLLWHDEDGFYYDRNERTGQPVKVKSVAGFMPLWAGIVPADRAERIIRQHLINPDEFWLAYPIAGYARTEPDYYQERYVSECNWRGTTWVPTNYAVFHGLMRLGYTEIAEQLAYRTFEMALREETTREYYNAETGSGQGLNPFWGWSALAYFMPLEFEMNYDPTDVETRGIVPLASAALGLDFTCRR
jgi:neutral trehalase